MRIYHKYLGLTIVCSSNYVKAKKLDGNMVISGRSLVSFLDKLGLMLKDLNLVDEDGNVWSFIGRIRMDFTAVGIKAFDYIIIRDDLDKPEWAI